PELLKHITVKEFEKFRNRNDPIVPPPPFNAGLNTAEDDQWKRIRGTLTPTLTGAKLKQMVPLLQESCDVLMRKFREAANLGTTMNVGPCFQQYVLEIVFKTAFGLDSSFQTHPNKDVVAKIGDLFATIFAPTKFSLICQSLPFFSSLRNIMVRAKILDYYQYFSAISSGIIAQRKKQGSDRKDLIQMMLTSVDKNGNQKLTDDEISAQAVQVLNAGLHTTSTRFISCCFVLAHFPEVQVKLIEEIDHALQANPDKPLYELVHDLDYLDCVLNEEIDHALQANPDKPLYELGHDLDYLDCVLNEELRLCFSSSTAINRRCTEACTIDGVHFPKGAGVILCVYLLHVDPDAWPEPFKFDPERFRGPAKEQRHPYQFIPFGAGPRSCIGMRLAQLEVKITLVRLLREFRFVLAPETKGFDAFRKAPGDVEIKIIHRHHR
ncbi:hypothetical protein QZH41_015646, partial [Actinostola sp. cb2023]